MEMEDGEQVIPNEICEEIVKVLQVKQLVGCKIVSKDWATMINWARLKKNHKDVQLKQGNFVPYLQSGNEFRTLMYEGSFVGSPPIRRILWDGEPDVQIVCACHGLVSYITTFDELFICNLSTGKRSLVPANPMDFHRPIWTARVVFGMGYVPESNDYKLVRIAVFVRGAYETNVQVYSRNKKKWKTMMSLPFNELVEAPCVFVSGRLHWLVSQGGDVNSIGYLKVGDMSYGSINLSGLSFPGVKSLRVENLDDSTLVVYNTIGADNGSFRIWVLYGDVGTGKWQPCDIVVPRDLIEMYPTVYVQPVRFHQNCHYLIVCRLDPIGTYCIYNTISKELREWAQSYVTFEGKHNIFKYVECLEDPESPWTIN